MEFTEARTGEHRGRRFRGEPVGWGACAEPGGALVNTGVCRAGVAHVLFGTRIGEARAVAPAEQRGGGGGPGGNAAWGGEGAVTAPPPHFLAPHFHFSGPEEKGFAASHTATSPQKMRELDNGTELADRPCPRKPGRQLSFRGPAAGLSAWGVASGKRGCTYPQIRHPVSKAVQITGCMHT